MNRIIKQWPWLVLGTAVLIALLAPLLATQDPYAQSLLARNLAPSAQHWLGTDSFGRDILARLVAGTRLTLLVAVAATCIAFMGGVGLGLIGCLAGGITRTVIYAGFDMILTLPAILLSLALMVALGVGTSSVILAVGIAFMPLFAYVTRAVYERESAAGYVTAARVIGVSPLAIAWRHVMPNAIGTLLTQIAIVMPRAITTESVLSFFGMGVAPDVPTWGRIIASAAGFAEQAPLSLLFPVLALALTTLSLSMVGNRMREHFDPLSKPLASGA
ncbi:ABC transporter permease [Pseudomonas sp. JUb96]|uniref:ABC transporter permease n=1 Tax=Pseudomonas sp. JUb96 TaxID=2940539 RepID=UPI00222706A1|nr:ABC transporter permease [Pseudomonas sp. JUb96]MCW2271845.1 ABC-type dipeptide/oligopeptide/nickel transport system permease subunit [Pseudomonas sp. JUb96]